MFHFSSHLENLSEFIIHYIYNEKHLHNSHMYDNYLFTKLYCYLILNHSLFCQYYKTFEIIDFNIFLYCYLYKVVRIHQ